MPDPIKNDDFEEITLDQLDSSTEKKDNTPTKEVADDFEDISFDELNDPVNEGETQTVLDDNEEEQFQLFMSTDPSVLKWKSEFEKEYGEFPDGESKDYDYRGAWKAGIKPQQTSTDPVPHWGSIGIDGKQLKSKDHPTRWKSDYMEALGKDPDEEGITKIEALKALKERNINVEHLATSSELDDDEVRMSLNDLRLVNPTKFSKEVDQIFKDENKYRPTTDRPAEKTRDTGNIAGDVFQLLGAGTLGVANSTMGTPESIYDFLEYGADEILGLGLGLAFDEDSEEYKNAKDLLGESFERIIPKAVVSMVSPIAGMVPRSAYKKLAKSDFRDWFKDKSAQLKAKANRYDKSFDYYMQTGEYANAFGSAAYSAIESLPASIIAGAVPGGVGAVGLMAASDRKEELDKVDNITEGAKFANAALHGVSEFVFEKFGTQQLGGLVKGTFKKFGKEAGKEIVEKGFKSTFKTMYKKLGLYIAPVQEGLSEAATTYANNWTDIMTGVDPDRNPMEGVLESFSTGAVMGLGGTAVQVSSDVATGVKKYTGRNKNADTEMFDQIASEKYGVQGEPKAEQKVPEQKAEDKNIKETPEQKIEKEIDATPAEEKSKYLKKKGININGLSQDEISKQFKTQKLGESKPSYSIGEKSFDSKEEFLAEVKKLKGKTDTPSINVQNDEQVDMEVQDILDPKIDKTEVKELATDFIDSPAKFTNPKTGKVEPGIIKQDGQSLVVETKTQIHELGNIDELKASSLEELGLAVESPVEVSEEGVISFRDKEYVNNFSQKENAVTFDEDGNVKSVSLETPKGEKRTFKGQAAEDIAYSIYLKEVADNSEFTKYIDQHETEITEELRQVAEETTAPVDEKVQGEPKEKVAPEEIDFKTPKKYALSKGSKTSPTAPEISIDDIDLKKSSLDDIGDVKKVKLLETRGVNRDGIAEGTVRITTDAGAETFEVFFKDKTAPEVKETKVEKEEEKTEFQKTEDQLTDEIIENSTDPEEIAATYLQELEKPANISYKEDIISKHMTKIQRQGYENNGDAGDLQKVRQIIPNYFKKDGRKIDDMAMELSNIAHVEITEQDIVDFINKHPNGQGSIAKAGGRSSELARQYKQLTKKKLTPELAKEVTKLTPEEMQQADGMADETFGVIKEKGINAETVSLLEDDISLEDVELLKEYYNARDKNETGSNVEGETGSKTSEVVEEKATKPKEEKVESKTEQTKKTETPEHKDQQIIDDVNNSNIQDLPPSRRVEVSEKLHTNNVLTKIVSKLQKALPNIKAVMNQKAYNEASEKFGRTDAAFVQDGVIYLDPSKTDKASAIEEFAHVWIDVAGEVNKTVLQKGLNLVKDSKYHEDVNNNSEYSDLDEIGKLKEALAKAITDKGQAIENRSGFKKFIGSFGEAVSKGLRKAGIVNRIKMFEDDLDSFSKKVSKELLSEVPISQVTDEDLAKIQKGLPHSDVTLDKSILDPKSKGAKRIAKSKAFTSSNKGAGQKLLDKKNRVKFTINAHVAKANFLVDDLSKQVTSFAKSLKGTKKEQKAAMQDVLLQIQELLTGGKDTELKGVDAITASDLPNDIKATAIRMRQQIDGLTNALQDEGVLVDEEITAILNQNLGVYMNRGYLKHAIQNYGENFKDYMTEEQYGKSVNFIRSRYESKAIKAVSFEKTKDGYIYTFTNEAGLETKRVVKDISKLDDVFSPSDIEEILKLQKEGDKGEHVLSQKTEPQYYIPFVLTTEHLNDVIIAGIVGDNGTPERMSPGHSQEDIGIGDKETSILKKRQEIDEPIRALLGEILDPKVNFLNSIASMAALLEKGKFEGDLVRDGLGTAITEKQTAENTVRITEDDSRNLGAKSYWTSPEIYELLYSKQETWNNPIWNAAIMMNGMTKAALTIGKNDSQARNYWGAFMNMAAAGALPANMLEAASVAFSDATNGQQIASLMSTPLALNLLAAKAFGKKNKEQVRDVFVEAVKYGLIGESVTSGVLNGIMDQVQVSQTDKGIWNKLKSMNKNAVELLSKPYEASDNIFKLSHWFTEIKRFKAIYPEKSMDEIKQIAASKVRNMQPTYSITSEAVKRLSRSPLAGSFIMFTSQMYRTRLAIIKEANAEMQEGIKTKNPKLKALAMKRYAGLAASIIVTPALAKVNHHVMGWSDDEDEGVAELSPSYSQNSTRFYLTRDKSNPQYMDFGFIDPSSVFHEIVIAGMRGDDVTDKFSEMFTAAIDPFANQEIFTQKVLEFVNGEDQYGQSLTNDAMPEYEKAGRNLWHLTEPLVPGLVTNGANLVKGYYGYETDYGKIFDWGNQVTNNIAGVKTKKIDLAKKGSKQIKRLVTEMNKGRGLYSDRLKSIEVQPFSKEDRYNQTNEYSAERFRLIQKKVRALSIFYSKKQIRSLLKDQNIGGYMIDQIMSNKFLGIDKKTGFFKKPAKKKLDFSNL